MKHLRDELEKDKLFGTKIEFITITIDPKFDTTEILTTYANTFEMKKTKGWHLLRGNEDETKKLADSFNFRYRDPEAVSIFILLIPIYSMKIIV